MNLYDKIRKLCAQRKISISRLEKETGLTKNSISKWGKSLPSADKLFKVAKYFNVTTDFLLSFENTDENTLKTCLAIIDVLNGFITESNKYIIPRINNIVCTNHFDLIVATKFINKPGSPFINLLDWNGLMDQVSQSIVPEIRSVSDKVIEKCGYTCFTEEFLRILYEFQIKKLFFCGVDTDACVLKSVLDCFEKNIPFSVFVNACASSGGQVYHEQALSIMERSVGKRALDFTEFS